MERKINIKKWYKSYDRAERDAKKYDCEIVSCANGIGTDIYYLIPRSEKPGTVCKVTTMSMFHADGAMTANRVVYKDLDGVLHVIEPVSAYRLDVVLMGKVPQDKAMDYMRGYYTRREETSEKIRIRKENARISHEICDLPGKDGHEIRQQIRRQLAAGSWI